MESVSQLRSKIHLGFTTTFRTGTVTVVGLGLAMIISGKFLREQLPKRT